MVFAILAEHHEGPIHKINDKIVYFFIDFLNRSVLNSQAQQMIKIHVDIKNT